jgi:hypothetical protein
MRKVILTVAMTIGMLFTTTARTFENPLVIGELDEMVEMTWHQYADSDNQKLMSGPDDKIQEYAKVFLSELGFSIDSPEFTIDKDGFKLSSWTTHLDDGSTINYDIIIHDYWTNLSVQR